MDFITEFQKLLFSQPTYNLRSVNNTNSPYAHMLTFSKNAYMCFAGWKLEDCFYCHYPFNLKDCCDTLFCGGSELLYECINCSHCYNLNHCMECVNTSDSWFSYDLRGCSNCFGCVGLRQKSYYIFNEPYSKEEYKKKLASMDISDPLVKKNIEERVEKLRLLHPHISEVHVNSQNCTGNHTVNSKDCYWAFDVIDAEDCCYVYHADKIKDCYDSEMIGSGELTYECMPGYNMYNCNFCVECGDVKNAEYSIRCFNSHDLFGCVARNHAEYEILNTKYPKDEYFKKVDEIKDKLKAEKKYTQWLPDIIGKLD